MKHVINTFIGLVLLASTDNNYAAADSDERGHRREPPPEAFIACKGKSEGDSAQFADNRRGNTVTGTCQQDRQGNLVLRPDRHKGSHQRPRDS